MSDRGFPPPKECAGGGCEIVHIDEAYTCEECEKVFCEFCIIQHEEKTGHDTGRIGRLGKRKRANGK